MNGKRLFWYSMGLKLMIIFFVISLAWGHKLISQKWFDPAVSDADKIFAVRYKEGNINARDQFGFTGLMVAAQQANVRLFQELMWAGADITIVSLDTPSRGGKPVPLHMLKTTVLHVIVQTAEVRPKEEIEILTFLFDLLRTRLQEGRSKVDVVSLVNTRDVSGYAPIHYVLLPTILEDRVKILDLLLANGAEFNAQNSYGDTMLHQAVRRNDRVWVKYVLTHYRQFFNKDVKNKEGLTIKDLAKKLNLTDMVALICTFKIYPCMPDEQWGIDTPRG